ncbi:MAG: glycosyltransferase family 4 protein, partial [Nanoarchaeota archaeon]|nr:glycosyltransferase family 4 protein [Nanoarchaeota archaeon]
MKVLMFGWEFPPNNRGGLGTACFGMTKALAKKGIKITFVLPRFSGNHEHLDILTTEGLVITDKRFKVKYIGSPLMPYMTSGEYDYEYRSNNLKSIATSGGDLYGSTLFQEVERYADKARLIARFENFDVIHCHDWMTFKAGMIAKKASGKPLVVHIHATDFDRTGGNPDQRVYDTEREGMHAADKVVAVSGYTKGMIVEHYGID